MGILDFLSPAKRRQKRMQSQMRTVIRKFAAAQRDRMKYAWKISDSGINQDIYQALRVLRMMSRDLCQNNPYFKKFLDMVSNNVVGPTGFSLQATAGETRGQKFIKDVGANAAIERSFYDWAKKGNCEVSGKLSFNQVLNIAIKAVFRDGEALILKVKGKTAGKYPFALQVIDIDRLDILKNVDQPNANPIRMGVEFERETQRVVAYWILTQHPGDSLYGEHSYAQHTRVPADQVYHLFRPERPEQLRGYPALHAVIDTAYQLGEYEMASLLAARIGAAKMGFFTSPDGTADALAEGKDETTGEFYDSAEGGVFGVLPKGYGFQNFNPDYPHQMFADFVKQHQRKIASGTGASYHTLANDLEGVNFSSIRSGTLEERDGWMCIQDWMIDSFLTPLFEDWISLCLLSGAITLDNGSPLPASKLEKFMSHSWQGRRWQWVDPRADIEAAQTAIALGVKSRTQLMAEQGSDFEDTMNQIKAEQDFMKENGIVLVDPRQPNAKPLNTGDQNAQTNQP